MDPARLRSEALDIRESVVMGVAGTAPAFSAAAATATLIGAVGTRAPGSLLDCGLIMFGVALAYMYLNRVNPNAGASYAWVRDEFGPVPGFLAGWALLVASAVFMVSGSIPAATATLMLVSPASVNEPARVALVAGAWFVIVSLVAMKGIKVASYTQVIMTGIEVVTLCVVVVAALVWHGGAAAHPFSWRWFSPEAFTPRSFANGAVTALFFFWGWDVTLNLTEETRDAVRAPGRGALIAMAIVLFLFVSFVTGTLLSLTDGEIQKSGTNVVFAVAEKLFPKPWSYMAILAVMLSTIGTLETSILQFTRTMYAQGRDRMLHPRYAAIHGRWQTPWIATLLILFIGLSLLALSSNFSTVDQIIRDSVNAIGFQVALYYGLACAACAWRYRRSSPRNVASFALQFVWPILSMGFLVFVALYSIPTFDATTIAVGLGGIAAGGVPLLVNRLRQ